MSKPDEGLGAWFRKIDEEVSKLRLRDTDQPGTGTPPKKRVAKMKVAKKPKKK
jgi:hypothetical protein